MLRDTSLRSSKDSKWQIDLEAIQIVADVREAKAYMLFQNPLRRVKTVFVMKSHAMKEHTEILHVVQ